MFDVSECAKVSAVEDADVAASDLVYGYLTVTACKSWETKEAHFLSEATVGNAVMVEVVWPSTENGVDGAKAGTGLGLTRMMCTTVGAGAF